MAKPYTPTPGSDIHAVWSVLSDSWVTIKDVDGLLRANNKNVNTGSISTHLRGLVEKGLAKQKKKGRYAYYSLGKGTQKPKVNGKKQELIESDAVVHDTLNIADMSVSQILQEYVNAVQENQRLKDTLQRIAYELHQIAEFK